MVNIDLDGFERWEKTDLRWSKNRLRKITRAIVELTFSTSSSKAHWTPSLVLALASMNNM